LRVKFLVDKVIDGKEYFWGMQYAYELFDEKLLNEFEKANEIKIIGRQEPQVIVIEGKEEEEKEIKEEEIKEVKRRRKTKKE
jgi:hypothetical protein